MNFIRSIKANIFIFLIISILFIQLVENASRKSKDLTTRSVPSKKTPSSKNSNSKNKRKLSKRKLHRRRKSSKNKKVNFSDVASPRSRLSFNKVVNLADKLNKENEHFLKEKSYENYRNTSDPRGYGR